MMPLKSSHIWEVKVNNLLTNLHIYKLCKMYRAYFQILKFQ